MIALRRMERRLQLAVAGDHAHRPMAETAVGDLPTTTKVKGTVAARAPRSA